MRIALHLSPAFLVFVAFSASLLAAAKPEVHVFILSGQSNMARLAPETSFLPEAKFLLPGATIVPIKVAVGGRPIRLWVPEWDRLATEAGLTQMSEQGPIYYEQILAEFKKVQAQHPRIASVTFCWMQGERDAKSGLAPMYERALTQLIANLRRDLKRANLNVVIGRLSDHRPDEASQTGWNAVRAIHVKVANEDPRGAWVDTDDLNNLTRKGQAVDDLHYSPEGYRLFGQRLARQAVRLIRGEKPDASGRPDAATR